MKRFSVHKSKSPTLQWYYNPWNSLHILFFSFYFLFVFFCDFYSTSTLNRSHSSVAKGSENATIARIKSALSNRHHVWREDMEPCVSGQSTMHSQRLLRYLACFSHAGQGLTRLLVQRLLITIVILRTVWLPRYITPYGVTRWAFSCFVQKFRWFSFEKTKQGKVPLDHDREPDK